VSRGGARALFPAAGLWPASTPAASVQLMLLLLFPPSFFFLLCVFSVALCLRGRKGGREGGQAEEEVERE